MKDLFVELARLQTGLAQATDTALTLRDTMLAATPGEAPLERRLTDHLHRLATVARELATAIQAQKIGINFTAQELPDPASKSSPTPFKKHPSKKAPKPRTR